MYGPGNRNRGTSTAHDGTTDESACERDHRNARRLSPAAAAARLPERRVGRHRDRAQPGSNPAFVMTGCAAGAVRNLSNAPAASGAGALVCRPAA